MSETTHTHPELFPTDPAGLPDARPTEVVELGDGELFEMTIEPVLAKVLGTHTDVLTAEGLTARNVTRWLDTQAKLARGPGAGGPQPVEGDQAWRLHAGDLVVVGDNAGEVMAFRPRS